MPRPLTPLPMSASDPWNDVVDGSLALHGSRIEFVHPRGAMELLYEQNFDANEAYPPYWAELWPSGVELAYAISERDLGGLRVLELGCGLGLPSIAAALAGGTVLATDRAPDSIAFTGSNAARSAAVLDAAVCSWTDADLIVDRAPWDLVLASDVLYGHRNITELLDLLPLLVDASGEVLIADPGRPLAAEFLEAARASFPEQTPIGTRQPAVTIHRLTR